MDRNRWMRAVRDFILTALLGALLAGCLFAGDFNPQMMWIRPHEPSYRPTLAQKSMSGFLWGGSVGTLIGVVVALNRLTDPPNPSD